MAVRNAFESKKERINYEPRLQNHLITSGSTALDLANRLILLDSTISSSTLADGPTLDWHSQKSN